MTTFPDQPPTRGPDDQPLPGHDPATPAPGGPPTEPGTPPTGPGREAPDGPGTPETEPGVSDHAGYDDDDDGDD